MAVERGDQEGGVGSRRRDAPPTRLRDFDGTVMPLLGGFGQYQKRLILLTWIPAIFIGFSQSSDSFFTAEPDFSCRNDSRRPPGRLVLAQLGGRLPNGTGAVLAPAPAPSPSHQHPEDNSSCQCTERDYILRAALTQNIVTKWNLVCDSSWMVHIAKFSLLVGLIIGYLVTGCLADWFGRQLVLAVSIVLMLIFGLMVALSVNVTMFSTLRFFEGFSLAGIFLTLYATRIELSLPRNRFMITMTASFITMGGQLLMPGLAVLCRDWQILQAIIICPFIFMLSYWCIFPESLRWLLATHQLHAAKDVFLDFAHKNRVHLEDDIKGFLTELDKEEPVARHNKTCIVKIIHTRILWKHILVLCVNS